MGDVVEQGSTPLQPGAGPRSVQHSTSGTEPEQVVRRRAEALSALQATVLDITVRRDLPSLLQTIVERATQLLNAPGGGLYLVEFPSGQARLPHGQARCVVSYNTPRDYRGIVLPCGVGAAGRVMCTGEPLIIQDYATWEGKASAFAEDDPFGPVLAAPMGWQGQVIGVIDVFRLPGEPGFDQEECNLLRLFSDHAAIAVENTRLYDRAQAELAERRRIEQLGQERSLYLERLIACTPDAVVTVDAAQRIREWNPGATRLFGYTREEAIGADLDTLIAGPNPEHYCQALDLTRRTLGGETIPPTETVRYRRDRTPVPVILAGSPIIVEGEPVGSVAVYTDVTEHKEARQALAESEERYRTLVQNLPIGVYRTSPGEQGRFLMANQAFLHMFGFESEQDLAKIHVSDLYANPAERRAFSDRVIEQGSVSGVDLNLKRSDGTTMWGSVMAKAVIDETTGEVEWFDCTIEDVTQRKRALEIQGLIYRIAGAVQLARDERTLFDTIRRELGTFLDTRNLFVAIYDAAKDEIALPYFVDEHDGAAYASQFRTFPAGNTLTGYVIRTNRPLLAREEEMRALEETGEVELVGTPSKVWLGVPLEASGSAARDPGQAAAGALVVQSYTDPTAYGRDEQEILEFVSGQIGLAIERVHAEKELRRLKEFNESIVQNMAEGIALQDADGYFTFVNPAAAEMLGYDGSPSSGNSLVGVHWTHVVPEDQQPIVAAADRRRLAGETDRYEVELVRRDGCRFPVLISGSPRFDGDEQTRGRFVGTLAVFTDISDRVAAEERLARHAQEMAALYETSLEINAQMNLPTLLSAIVERAARLANVRMGGLYLARPDGQTLELVVGHNLPVERIGTILHLGEGLSGRIAETGEPMMVEDYQQWDGRAGAYARDQFRRVLGVPMKVGDRVIGVINLTDDRHTGVFAEDEVRLASLFADQAAIAVENARLFEAEARRRREAETLRMATQALSATLDLQKVLGLILSELQQVVPYDSASVQQLVHDEVTGTSKMVLIGGVGFENIASLVGVSFDLQADDNPNIRVANSRAPVILNDASADYKEFQREPHAAAGIRSWLGVPLLFGDRLIGMIALDKREYGFYTDEHAELARAFAAQAAIAMENANLFEAEREQRELAEALRQATTAVSSSLDLDQILDQILEQVDRVIPGDAVNVTLIEGDVARIVRCRGYDRFGTNVESLALPLVDTPSLRWMQETGEAMIIADTSTYEGWVSLPEVAWIHSYAAAPIRARDRLIGFLNVDSATPGFFSQTHADRLQAFADQASVAIANAQLFRIVEQAKRDWEATFDAMQDPVVLVDSEGRVVRGNLAFAHLVDLPIEQLVGEAYASILDVGHDGEQTPVPDLQGPSEGNSGPSRGHPPLGRVGGCTRTECALEQLAGIRSQSPHTGERMATCVHQYQGRIFEVQATVVDGTPASDQNRVARVIYAMRDITERKRAEEEIQRRNRDLAFLNRIVAAAAARRPVEATLATICQELAYAFDVPRVVTWLLNLDRTEGSVVAAHLDQGQAGAGVEQIRLDGEGDIQEIFETIPDLEGRPGGAEVLVLDGSAKDPAARDVAVRRLLGWSEQAAGLWLPLIVEGQVVGYLEVMTRERRHFGADEIGLARRVAEQAATVLARARLEETERRLSAAVEQAAEAVVITDTDFTILYANPAFEQITGLKRSEVVGTGSRGIAAIMAEVAADHELWSTVMSGQIWQGRITGRKPDGIPYVVDMTITPVRTAPPESRDGAVGITGAGEVINHVATMRDVTREMQLEEQFQQAQKMEALGRLAGGIAHDFNNLLTVIHLSTRLLERQLRPEDPLWEHVQHIRQTGDRAAKLTKQLLSFSRREVIDPHVVSVNRIVGDLERMLQRIIGEDVQLVTDLQEDLWAVRADPAQMEQVMMNLVVNARDAMPRGGILTIKTENVTLSPAYVAFHVDAEPGEHVLLSVVDTGEGMDAAVKVHLFEPFFTTKQRGQGTGLGLSTVFGIVKQHSGHIHVESEPGQGTAFYIYLPRCLDADVAAAVPIGLLDAQRATGPRRVVLVVEDDEAVRTLATRVLQSYGCQVLQASNGIDALHLSREYRGRIDLLLTDVVMPLMDGKKLADDLQATRPETAVLYMSGYADNILLDPDALPPGAAFLSKPFTVETLIQKVQGVLDAHMLRRRNQG
ncbi:MAG: GAF domain-containing protein [Anaerolineae bacterium]|nr:GAF domain-containing protein [Anaerolineae bacterium]